MASLINTSASHQRFSTQNVTVVAGETYLIEMWVAGAAGQLRTGFYDATNAAYNTYNSYFNMATESAGNLVLLTQEVTVPAGCTSGQFILSLHSTDPTYAGAPFYLGIIVDSVAISATTPTPPTITSIYDIQYTTDISGDSPENGNVVTTSGIVTGVIAFGGDADRFFIQDGDGAWNGIYVYENGYTVALGDSVDVTGTVTEYFGLTEISSVTNVTVVSSGNAQPTPVAISTGDAAQEQYECVLVQVSDALCSVADDGFGGFTVNDGSGNRVIDDQVIDTYPIVPTVGNAYQVTGIPFLSFSEVKILPRVAGDVVVTDFAGIEENNTFTIYPNPSNSVVVLTVQPDAVIRIYSVSGALVYEAVGETTIDVSNFEAGIYQVTVLQNETTSTQKLSIQ
jgi:DNA/RNA endonuclease YhcR with UshA esterase domain